MYNVHNGSHLHFKHKPKMLYFRRLGILRTSFPKIPILTVTATATKTVREDICSSLGLRCVCHFCGVEVEGVLCRLIRTERDMLLKSYKYNNNNIDNDGGRDNGNGIDNSNDM